METLTFPTGKIEEEIIEWVYQGGDVNACNKNGMSLLQIAVSTRNTELVAFLIEKGCDINQQDTDGDTPLHNAIDLEADYSLVEKGGINTSISELLVKAGADKTITNNRSQTPMDYASFWKHPLVNHR